MVEKKKINNPTLRSWTALNDFLRDCSQQAAERLLKEELDGRQRKQFLSRIHSRINKTRADKERAELLTGAGDKAKTKKVAK